MGRSYNGNYFSLLKRKSGSDSQASHLTTAGSEARAIHNRRYYEKNKELVKERNKANKIRNREYIRNIKENTPCADCGNKFPAVCMDFDHIGDDKRDNVATLALNGVSIATLDAEIAKCELVCANCHRIRTVSRIERPWLNGRARDS